VSDVDDLAQRLELYIRRQAGELAKTAPITPESATDARHFKGTPYTHSAVSRLGDTFDARLQETYDPEIRITKALEILVDTAKYHGFHDGFSFAYDRYTPETED